MTTPMRRQYLQIKRQYPDAVVLFRLGDFYETFDEDAKLVARVCDVVLTSRPVGKGQRVPLAGVPYHAVDTYLAKLIEAGHRVAIVEQMEEQAGKGLVSREVVRVVTPGTILEPALLEEKQNNYLAALAVEGARVGLAYVDASTGEFAATQFEGPDIWALVAEEVARLDPAEVLTTDPAGLERALPANAHHRPALTEVPGWYFDLEQAQGVLQRQFEVASLGGFGLDGKPLAVQAAGAVVAYLHETQRGMLGRLQPPRTYATSDFMLLDPATRRNLELVETIRGGRTEGSLLGVLDLTQTPMGGRLLRKRLLQPLLDVERLCRRLDAVEVFYTNTPLRLEVGQRLRGLGDLERLIQRVSNGTAGPRDLLGVRKALGTIPLLRAALEKGKADRSPLMAILGQLQSRLDPCDEVVGLIERAIAEDAPVTLSGGRVIKEGFSPELDGIQRSAEGAREWVAGLQERERQRTGIKSLKVGYNKVFGYYLEVTKPNLHLVPDNYVRKQTLTNAERYITPELKEYESLILNAEERIGELEAEIFKSVRAKVAESADRVQTTAEVLAELDVHVALAEAAHRNRYVRPTLTDGERIDIIAGRHPVVELTLRDEPFVPNDVHLTPEESILLITGPNMSGKSTYLRQVALIVLMAQIGSFVPADSAEIGLVDRIFTRIGAQDEIYAGRSTFMVEMLETANILHHATSRSLLVLDEIGRGTSTYDGISIAWAVVEYLHNHPRLRCKTLFATHYHELIALEEVLPRVRNYNVAVAEDGEKIVFLRRIVPGGADRSYGIQVAQLAGLPRQVIQRAMEILTNLEQNSHRAPGAPARPQPQQLALFSLSDPVAEEIEALDIATMTPLEALNKLYELQRALQARRRQR